MDNVSINLLSAAGDPHIIIEDPDTEVRMCFDIHSPYGTVVSLIEDAKFGKHFTNN